MTFGGTSIYLLIIGFLIFTLLVGILFDFLSSKKKKASMDELQSSFNELTDKNIELSSENTDQKNQLNDLAYYKKQTEILTDEYKILKTKYSDLEQKLANSEASISQNSINENDEITASNLVSEEDYLSLLETDYRNFEETIKILKEENIKLFSSTEHLKKQLTDNSIEPIIEETNTEEIPQEDTTVSTNDFENSLEASSSIESDKQKTTEKAFENSNTEAVNSLISHQDTSTDETISNNTNVLFHLPSDQVTSAKEVLLIGEFNDWDSDKGIPLQKNSDGSMSIEISLEKGKSYEYRYLLDGKKWINDARCNPHTFVDAFKINNCTVSVD